MFNLKHPLFDEATPAEAPAPVGGSAAPTPAPTGPKGSDVDWVGESDLHATDTPEAPAAPAAPVVPATPAAAPVVPPVAAPVAAPAPAAVVPQVPAPAVPVEAPAPVAQPTPAPAPAVDLSELRNREITRLQSVYALNAEDASSILTSPETVVPKMLANLHVQVCDSIIGAIMGRIPETVEQVMQQGRAARDAEDDFHKAWPMLKDGKYRETVGRCIQAYRQVNPRASREETIRASGLNALITLRLPIPPELLAVPQPQAPAAPSFQPASPAGGGALPVPAKSTNPYQLLNEEFDKDERG